ncbi:MAG: (Fe-S)-binding protein [Coriobacteriales bacterium]|jgi:Fe-S oxidoreductase|nr:(Fe-S)-binding protein [Coriobacteriales bacterium]
MFDFDQIDDACIRCGLCMSQQRAEGMPALMCGDIAQTFANVKDATEIPEDTYEFVRSCSLCDACTAACPRKLSCAEVCRAARQVLARLQPELADEYRVFRMDVCENLFAGMRLAGNIVYSEYLGGPAPPLELDASQPRATQPSAQRTLFMPGCTLSSYAEEVTRATFELLVARGAVCGMTAYCCGNPLSNAGLIDDYNRYAAGFARLLQRHRIDSIVVACPNCLRRLEFLVEQNSLEIILVPLPTVLVELGVRYTPVPTALDVPTTATADTPTMPVHPSGDNVEIQGAPKLTQTKVLTLTPTAAPPCPSSISVHDSCPDRESGRFGRATRHLFIDSNIDLVEMANNGKKTICCGSGGLAQVYGPEHPRARRDRRLEQFAATGADCLVCSCISCVNMFLSAPDAPPVRHYLELILGKHIDWARMAHNMDKATVAKGSLDTALADATPVFADA